MAQQLNISDSTAGLSYKKMNDSETGMRHLLGKRIGEEINGDPLGFNDYVFKITGGSDSDGFPMNAGVAGGVRKKILTTGGVGFHPPRERDGVRIKKRVRGNTITEDIYQINLLIITKGKRKIEEILAEESK